MAITKEGESQGFGYKGSVESFIIPYEGLYLLEANGAGTTGTTGGRTGIYAYLTKKQTIYVCVGSVGTWEQDMTDFAGGTIHDIAGGYNGGCAGHVDDDYSNGSGGGATHFATSNHGTIVGYGGYTGDLLCVASGGTGKHTTKATWTEDDGWHAGINTRYPFAGNSAFGGNYSAFTSNKVGSGLGGGYGLSWVNVQTFDDENDSYGTVSTEAPTGYYKYASMTYDDIVYNSYYSTGGNSGNGSATITLIKKAMPATLYLGGLELTGIFVGNNEIKSAFLGNKDLG